MHIFEPFHLAKIHSEPKPTELADHAPSLDFDDPDSMYDLWVKPYLNDDLNSFSKKDCISQLNDIFEIYLNLKRALPKINSHQLLKEMSIQISLYEALVFRDMFLNQTPETWRLQKATPSSNNHQFYFKSNHHLAAININGNNVKLSLDNSIIGQLKIDMEHVLLEKIHGSLFNKPLIIDPIWIKKQIKLDAVKIQIDQYKTEIVHKPKHKDTLWIDGKGTSVMTVSKNQSISLNKKLLMNIKKIHWKSMIIHSLQWYTPWFRFPIQGIYKLDRDKTHKI